ncbi:MAG TPA: glycosyltransferase [Puia sp.]|nr:glycosyltransferase [Puia sp.]
MFSILVCSVNEDYLSALKTNLSETIGLPYELLVWDNRKSPLPITAVYNRLGSEARYPYHCFIHEDILFTIPNWAQQLIDAFESDPTLGLIGVAGAKYKSKTPSGWSTGIREFDCVNILHRDKNDQTLRLYSNPNQSALEPVVNVDGVFMCIRQEVWNTTRFNEEMLRGFHLYDIDFSFRVGRQYKVAVIFSIDIVHLTEGGNFGNEWLETTLRWHSEFGRQLPDFTAGIGSSGKRERKIRRNWLYRLSTETISWQNKMKWIFQSKAWADPSAWPYVAFFLFRKRTR